MGASAGTHIATSSTRHVEYFDSNDVNLIDFKGLNLYNGIIICHYNKNRNKIYQKLKIKRKYAVETLKDDEILFLENNIWKKM